MKCACQVSKHGRQAEGVHLKVLESLIAIAAACARLHLREEIVPFPDAVLAIKLIDDSLQNKVCNGCLSNFDTTETPSKA